MANAIKAAVKAALDKATAIKTAAEAKAAQNGGVWSKEDATAFEAALGEFDRVKAQADLTDRFDGSKAWAEGSDGEGAVKSGWRTSGPAEGDIPGVTDDNGEYVVDEKLPDEYKSLGAAKIKTLRSGTYKDAYNAMIRAQGLRAEGWERAMKAGHMKVLQEGQDSAGGFWVPPDVRNQVVAKMATVPGVMNDVYKFTTGSDMVTFPQVIYTTDDLYTTGILPSWTAEAPSSDISEATNPVAGKVQIPVHTLTAAILMTRAILEDAQFDILGYVSNKLGENIPLFVNNALINGDGIGKPQGIMNHSLATTAAPSGLQVLSNVAGALSWQGASGAEDPTKGYLGVEGALPPQYEGGAKWYASKATYAATRGLVDANKRPLWQQTDGAFQSWVKGYPPTLLGYPIVKDQFMPAIGAANRPVMLGDLQGYYMPQRVGMSVEVLREIKALRDMVVIYARMRLGGELVEYWRVKLMKSNNS